MRSMAALNVLSASSSDAANTYAPATSTTVLVAT